MMKVHYSNTEWLYAPGFVYHQYDDVSRELGMIFPYRSEWTSDERFPLVMYIPGSAWHKQELYNDVPKYTRLAEQGNVFAIVQVRESGIAPFPAQLEDIHRAVAWLIAHADQFHIDTNLIFLAGNSSGGHLALLTAFTKAHGKYIPHGIPDYSIAGVIGQAASSDIKMCQSSPWPAERGKRPTTCLMGVDTDEECLEKADVAVCKNYVTDDIPLPPVLLLHFADDPVVNSQMSRDLWQCLVNTGHQANYHELAGGEHGGNGLWALEVIDIIETFIFRYQKPDLFQERFHKFMDITPKERIILNHICSRPCMYIGEYSLPRLASFLDGYRMALLNHDPDNQYCILPRKFHEFVTEKYGLPAPMGYCNAILENVPDGKEAVETFFELLDEFLESNGFEKIH